MTTVSVRRDIQEHIVDSLSVKVVASMGGDVLHQTDVLVPMGLLDLNVKETIGLGHASL